MTLRGIHKQTIISYRTLLARYGYKPPCEFSAIEPRTELKLMTAALEALSGSDDLFCAALFKRGTKAWKADYNIIRMNKTSAHSRTNVHLVNDTFVKKCTLA